MKLLVVDDDTVIRMTLRTLLTAEGYSVVTAADGEEALARLSETKFHLVISDVYMPRMDGITMRNTVRRVSAFARLPFLFISGYADQLTREAVKNTKLEGLFKKGHPVTELLAWIKFLTTPVSKRHNSPPVADEKATLRHQVITRQRGGLRLHAV